MSMILLEPANTILQTSGEDQAADHLINGVSGNNGIELAEIPTLLALRDYFRFARDRPES
jgi:hypothetical protein